MVKFIFVKSPDEWTTMKQACRDELIVYLFFSSTIYTSLYLLALRIECKRKTIVKYQLKFWNIK